MSKNARDCFAVILQTSCVNQDGPHIFCGGQTTDNSTLKEIDATFIKPSQNSKGFMPWHQVPPHSAAKDVKVLSSSTASCFIIMAEVVQYTKWQAPRSHTALP